MNRLASRLSFAVWVALMAVWTPHAQAQSRVPGYSPNAQDFEFPLQDLDEIKGEIIWLQGGLKRGDPTPYQNPLIPLAAYEQGLLDRDGNLWTFLDNPKGRELRYNKQLRGKEVEVRGWLYDKAQIVEVYSWRDSQAHPVRVDMEYPEPIKVPFEPEKAETIEPIPPVSPEVPGKGMIGEDMWKQKEGLDLIEGTEVAPPALPPESDEDADLLKRFLEEAPPDEAIPDSGDSETEDAENSDDASTGGGSEPMSIDLRRSPSNEGGPALPPFPRGSSPNNLEDRSDSSQIQEGITDPEEIFEESRRALLRQ